LLIGNRSIKNDRFFYLSNDKQVKKMLYFIYFLSQYVNELCNAGLYALGINCH
jgi:hypothetical protein